MNTTQMPSPVPYKLLQTPKALCQQTELHTSVRYIPSDVRRLCHYFTFDYALKRRPLARSRRTSWPMGG